MKKCRMCGRTDSDACVSAGGRPCFWLEDDLCSACAVKDFAALEQLSPRIMVESIGRAIQERLSVTPQIARILEMGWQVKFDQPVERRIIVP